MSMVACLCAWVGGKAVAPGGPTPAPFDMRGSWLSSPDPRAQVAQFRRTFFVTSDVRVAWIAVAAHEGYEVIVNGTTGGQSLLWRPTRPFQTGLSEGGQRVTPPESLLDLNFPREYQWEGHQGERLPGLFDIGPYLSPGKNVVCIEVETRAPPVALSVDGEVLLWSGERIALASDGDYKAAPEPPSTSAWTRADFVDGDWPEAPRTDPAPGRTLRVVDPDVYREPFAGRELRARRDLPEAAWFETTWHLGQLTQAPRDAWVRILTDRAFQLFVNDQPVRVTDVEPGQVDTGDWVIGPRTSVDAPAVVDPLDPDQVGTLFNGTRLDRPFDGIGPNALPDPDAVGAVTLGVPVGSPAQPSVLGPDLSLGQPLAQETTIQGGSALRGTQVDFPAKAGSSGPAPVSPPIDPVGAAARTSAPKELARPQSRESLYAYGLADVLVRGDNRIAVRLSPPDTPNPLVWPPRIAIDGRATAADGQTIALDASGGWIARTQATDGALSESVDVVAGAPVAEPGVVLPRLQYRGTAERSLWSGAWRAAVGFGIAAALLALLGWLPGRMGARWGLADASTAILLPAALLTSTVLVAWSWVERDEILVLLAPGPWRVVLACALAAGFASVFAVLRGGLAGASLAERLRAAPSRKAWGLAVALTVALAAVLRARAMQLQPLDDDELASTQAILAIARTGLPRLTDDVFYTRGPLCHYIAAASVLVLGPNAWALRLPGVLFAAATSLLVYRTGARLLKSPWTGLAAALLYAVHPYAIFVGHLVRFYQQQQFFALAAAYFFCRGFVSPSARPMTARYLALASFAAACLSQELSVVMVPALLVAYVLFAPKTDGPSSMKLAFTAACAGAIVLLDVAVFQTRCLTKLEGMSPNVEATLALHFTSPTNLVALFVSYSRLHLALSVLLAASVPLLVRRREPEALTLLIVLCVGVVATNLLVTAQSLRYQYWLLPIWLVLGVFGVRELTAWAADACADSAADPARGALVRGWLAPLAGAVALVAVALSWSPWRIAGSYETKLLGDSAAAFRYVKSQLRDGDRVAATEPHAHAGKVEIGRIDYDLAVPLLDDYVYRKGGRLVDRNGGAQVLSSLDQLKDVVATTDRLWVLVNREKFRSRGNDVRWEFPGAQVETFLRRNFAVKFQSYLWTVFLWDAGAGRFHSLPPSEAISWAGTD
jgi:4-amino-4-deoxy-L-arabinose transferase-like glycosyltransferase